MKNKIIVGDKGDSYRLFTVEIRELRGYEPPIINSLVIEDRNCTLTANKLAEILIGFPNQKHKYRFLHKLNEMIEDGKEYHGFEIKERIVRFIDEFSIFEK